MCAHVLVGLDLLLVLDLLVVPVAVLPYRCTGTTLLLVVVIVLTSQWWGKISPVLPVRTAR